MCVFYFIYSESLSQSDKSYGEMKKTERKFLFLQHLTIKLISLNVDLEFNIMSTKQNKTVQHVVRVSGVNIITPVLRKCDFVYL